MISHSDFGKLRLVQFLPESEITDLENWEFMGDLWIGEAVGFSEWLRLEARPDTLRSLAIDFSDFPEPAGMLVLQAIDLNISAGMNLDELRGALGAPVEEHRFVEDRVSYRFRVLGPHSYNVSCTVLNNGGLTYLVVMAGLSDLPC